jgi:hypothetical protein
MQKICSILSREQVMYVELKYVFLFCTCVMMFDSSSGVSSPLRARLNLSISACQNENHDKNLHTYESFVKQAEGAQILHRTFHRCTWTFWVHHIEFKTQFCLIMKPVLRILDLRGWNVKKKW